MSASADKYEVPDDAAGPGSPQAIEKAGAATWTVPGPVSAAFMQSDQFVRAIKGPYGSAKTSSAMVDILFKAIRQPRCLDGKRHHKALLLRDTYRDLYKTTLPTWFSWFPKELGDFVGGTDRPFTHTIEFEDKFGIIKLTVEGAAIGEHKAEDVLDGYEPTQVFLNAASSLNEDVLRYMIGRMGRYPTAMMLPAGVRAWTGISLDFNPPDTDHWLYKRFVEMELSNHVLFDQPGGRDPAAENVKNLDPEYYDRMIEGNEAWWTRRFVDNQWGYSREGEPVYPQYDDTIHCAPVKLSPLPDRPIGIGIDGGKTLRPAIIFGQIDQEGCWRLIDELVPGRCGASACSDKFNALRTEKYSNFEFYAFGDPTIADGADRENGELAWSDTFYARTGIHIELAPSNELGLRLDAVKDALERRLPGGRPGLQMDPSMKILRKGFASHYRMKRVRTASTDRFEDKPEKNDFSHPHDALQYLILGREGAQAVKSGRRSSLVASDNALASGDALPAQTWSPYDA